MESFNILDFWGVKEMAKGKIIVKGNKISLETKGKPLTNIELGENIKKDELKHNAEVEYTQHGNKAIISKILKQGEDITKSSFHAPQISKNGRLLFNYPYNFVRFGNKVVRKKREKGKLTGVLECSLINKSPLFIPEKKLDKVAKGHSEEYFLKENDNYVIPASSIKGAIRSVVEAISNSCVINIEEDRLDERKTAGDFKNIKYGFIKKIPKDGEDGSIVEAEIVRVLRNEALKYKEEGIEELKFNNTIYDYKSKGYPYRPEDILKNIEDVTKDGEIEGFLWVSAKKSRNLYEKIFIPKKGKKIDDGDNQYTKEDTYVLSYEEYENIKYIVEQRIQREEKKGNEFYKTKVEIKDPIIFQVNGINGKNLAISEIPRLRYKYSPYDLLDEKLHACKNSEEACAACRIFGMTGEQQEKENKIINTISKVFISDAIISKNDANIEEKPRLIKSLGEPHPTLTGFYLDKGDYNDDTSILRGRKFYWHHKDKIGEDKDRDSIYNSIKAERKEPHNSSIQFMHSGNKFTFQIRFENMTEEEFGLLLYAIELEGNMLHKIGKAKAFGFGSCKIEIENIKLDVNEKDKYTDFFSKVTPLNLQNKDFYKKLFKQEYLYDNSIQKEDLMIIMSSENKLDFRESPFPEAEVQGKPEKGRNSLNWFMNMKREYKELFKLPAIQEYK